MRFSNYYNHEGRNRKIYSRQNLMNMSLKEMLERELELAYQYNTIGIPLDEELLSSQYAHQYMTENGLPYWQAGEDMQNKLEQKQKTDAQRAQIKSQLESNIQGLTARTNSQQFNSNPIQSLDNSDIINEPSYQNRTDSSLLEGFGQTLAQKVTQKKNQEFPDLGRENSSVKQDDLRNVEDSQKEDMYESFAQNYPEELIRNYLDEEQESSIPNDVKLDETEETSKTSKNTDRYLEPEDIMPELAYKKNGDKMMEQEDKGSLTGAAATVENIPLFELSAKKSNQDSMTFWEKGLDKVLKNEKLVQKLYPIAADMYTDSVSDFSRRRQNPNATILEDMSSLDKKTINELSKYGVSSTERGVYHNPDSYVSKKFANSKEIKDAFNKNMEAIKNGSFQSEDLNFDAGLLDAIINWRKFDRYASLQHAKLIDAYIDEQGRRHGRLIDNYDFNKRNSNNIFGKLKNIPNNYAYNMQEKGNLENYYTIIDIILDAIDEEEQKQLRRT